MTSFFYNKIGEYFGHKDNCPCVEDIPDFEAGLLVDPGITWVLFLDKLLVPEEIREARSTCEVFQCGKEPICRPFIRKPQRPSCYKSPFPKSSCP